MKSAPRALALMGACAMAAAALQGTAAASSADSVARIASQIQTHTLSSAIAPNADATFLGGYAAGFPGAVKTVTTMTVNKTGTCGSADKAVTAQSYHLGAADLAGAFAYSGCLDGEAFAFVRLESFTAEAVTPEEVTEPGDKIKVTITESATGTKVAVVNNTQGWKAATNFPKVSAEEYQVGNGRVFLTGSADPLPQQKFGTTAYTGNTISGTPLGNTSPTKVQLVNAAGDRIATASAFANGGKDFSVKWVKAA